MTRLREAEGKKEVRGLGEELLVIQGPGCWFIVMSCYLRLP